MKDCCESPHRDITERERAEGDRLRLGSTVISTISAYHTSICQSRNGRDDAGLLAPRKH